MVKPICSIPGCGRNATSHGWCSGHYARWRKHGDVQANIPLRELRPGVICSVAGCDRPATSLGWCQTHYARVRKHGDVRADIPLRHLRPRNLSTTEAFRHYMPGDPPGIEECWPWTGTLDHGGYGVISSNIAGQTRQVLAHRVAYEIFIGPVPDEQPFFCHHCDNPPCCNPHHIYAGTPLDNFNDMVVRDRKKAAFILSPSQVTAMRCKYSAGGWTYDDLAAEFGVSAATVYNVIKKKAAYQ